MEVKLGPGKLREVIENPDRTHRMKYFWPWKAMEVGDYFIAPPDAGLYLRAKASERGKVLGVRFRVEIDSAGIFTVHRTA